MTAQRRSFRDGDEPWRPAILAALQRRLGPGRRTAGGKFRQPLTGHLGVFKRFPFSRVEPRRFEGRARWDCRSMLGFRNSTSFAARSLFGEGVGGFEDEFRRAWAALSADGLIVEQIRHAAVFAWK